MVFHAELENEAQTIPNMVKNPIFIKNPIFYKNSIFYKKSFFFIGAAASAGGL